MKTIVKLIATFILLEISFPQKAYAYLDPGTGSMVVQIIIAGIAGIGCTLAIWKENIIKFFKRK